ASFESMHSASPTHRVGKSEQRSLLVCGVQEDRRDLRGKWLATTHAYRTGRQEPKLSNERDAIHVGIPIQRFFAASRVAEWRGCVRSRLPESESGFVQDRR